MRSRSASVVVLALFVVFALARPAPVVALNDPEYARQWGMERIGAKAAWDAGLLGEGVDIAVVDSGVHLTHQDLRANVISGYDFVNDDERPQDDNEHGTHVAGIAAGVIDNGGVVGVAPRARIIPVKVLDENFATVGSDVGAGIRWAVDHGAEVINLSLGNVGQSVFGPATQQAVAYAWSKGVICVFAAGNDYVMSSGFDDESAIVVASTNRSDARSSFSNKIGNAKWGLAAPGSDIFSTIWVSDDQTNTYASLSGTSMAAPHVAGAAALLRAAGLSPQQTVDRLLATAKDLGPPGRDDEFGHGRLDVAKAVAGLTGGTTTATTAPATTSAPPTSAVSSSGSPSTRPAPATTARPRTVAPPTTPSPDPATTDTTAVPPPSTEAPPVDAVADILAPPDDEAVEVVAPSSGTGSSGDDRLPAPLVVLASMAAATTAGWALWLVWRRRAENAR